MNGSELPLHPLASLTVTVYPPAALVVIRRDVSPVDHL
jgi:hypothetical protein